MSFEYPQDFRYLDTHEYVRLDGEIGTIGITEFAVDQLGDIVFLELPDVGDIVTKGKRFGTVESAKAVEELNSPVTGTVIEINEALLESPDNLEDDPYWEHWLIKVRVDDHDEVLDAMTADEYCLLVQGERNEGE
ncbi:glycine cleavage system protein GcvH [Umezakia ovalisporum]|jgi:glycine cleavage system H protein|uniref:Glycine cleavage system H protein n=2 Tax=Umezakia ovalisporum TaxID=75695 RepID=A0AA43KFC9_9CYAN|nr:glycine cleavage system protein GcvH [Umezakia ovalisporum]MBI1241133.1 glycine cleavage system protein GcvH [Nostoc sp. RI_552]MDH6056502.1 glycine cleavage system protein GcvH [Umezakia ovalisporum FSS-43]MDH6064020.1 glycine cleavage system protein GcvH [Umezakia ovalisporum FSS-62]MDH6065742.1 glycine cleavage system protein GcvH [Umezakia ovalisporum APH033B]MDH6069252.1 glycine cleavage system protein GcvH [Umezakia ovalisporum CobakiLakeA]